MSPRHHLDPATVLGFAAGSLGPEMSVVASAHMESCGHCRQQLRLAERIGGLLLDQQACAVPGKDTQAALRQAMVDKLDRIPDSRSEQGLSPMGASSARDDVDRLPAALQPHFGSSYRSLKWNWMAPGVHCIRAPGLPSLMMMKIAPGTSLPMHSHGNSELTQVLQGAYDDALGHFAPGDAADLGDDVEHQPVTTPGVACICVCALDAPLVFRGWIARKLQKVLNL